MLFQIQTIRFEVHPLWFKEKNQPCAVACFSIFWEKYPPGCWNLKDLVTLSCGALTTCVKRFPVSLSCAKLSFSVQSLRISRFCIWPLVYILCFFPCWRREQQCLCGTSGALQLTREKRDWCWRACCRQHFQSNHSLPCPSCNIWKGSLQIWSHLGAHWLVKHLLVRSLQSHFDWRWKSHLNPCH